MRVGEAKAIRGGTAASAVALSASLGLVAFATAQAEPDPPCSRTTYDTAPRSKARQYLVGRRALVVHNSSLWRKGRRADVIHFPESASAFGQKIHAALAAEPAFVRRYRWVFEHGNDPAVRVHYPSRVVVITGSRSTFPEDPADIPLLRSKSRWRPRQAQTAPEAASSTSATVQEASTALATRGEVLPAPALGSSSDVAPRPGGRSPDFIPKPRSVTREGIEYDTPAGRWLYRQWLQREYPPSPLKPLLDRVRPEVPRKVWSAIRRGLESSGTIGRVVHGEYRIRFRKGPRPGLIVDHKKRRILVVAEDLASFPEHPLLVERE